MKIGLFGGAFDPPHLGHKKIILTALEQNLVDKLIVIPSYKGIFKQSFYHSYNERIKYLHSLLENIPEICRQKIEISKIEETLFEQKNPETTYTIDLVSHFKTIYADIWLIIGADQFIEFKKWHQWQALLQATKLLVFNRADKLKSDKAQEFIFEFNEITRVLAYNNFNEDISSTRLRLDNKGG